MAYLRYLSMLNILDNKKIAENKEVFVEMDDPFLLSDNEKNKLAAFLMQIFNGHELSFLNEKEIVLRIFSAVIPAEAKIELDEGEFFPAHVNTLNIELSKNYTSDFRKLQGLDKGVLRPAVYVNYSEEKKDANCLEYSLLLYHLLKLANIDNVGFFIDQESSHVNLQVGAAGDFYVLDCAADGYSFIKNPFKRTEKPENFFVYWNTWHGKVLYFRRDRNYLPQAIDFLKKANKVDKNCWYTIETLSNCYFMVGDKEKAISLLKEGVAANPTNERLQKILRRYSSN